MTDFCKRYGRQVLLLLGLPLKSLDGQTVIGDAFTKAGVETPGC